MVECAWRVEEGRDDSSRTTASRVPGEGRMVDVGVDAFPPVTGNLPDQTRLPLITLDEARRAVELR